MFCTLINKKIIIITKNSFDFKNKKSKQQKIFFIFYLKKIKNRSVTKPKRFEESIVKRSSIPEHGSELVLGNLPYFDEIIVARTWEQFFKSPRVGVLPVVREFYANAYEHITI